MELVIDFYLSTLFFLSIFSTLCWFDNPPCFVVVFFLFFRLQWGLSPHNTSTEPLKPTGPGQGSPLVVARICRALSSRAKLHTHNDAPGPGPGPGKPIKHVQRRDMEDLAASGNGGTHQPSPAPRAAGGMAAVASQVSHVSSLDELRPFFEALRNKHQKQQRQQQQLKVAVSSVVMPTGHAPQLHLAEVEVLKDFLEQPS